MEYAEFLATNGGWTTCGGGLGVMVAPGKDIERVPPGWVFVPLETATPGKVQEAIDHAKQGRLNWPKKEDKPKASRGTSQQKQPGKVSHDKAKLPAAGGWRGHDKAH